ncbi:4'-phosphopantetheinyl transferase family protein [Phytohalomonas tamaricis]|uniref:4'-phosphopantetheinyl transferase family protein n=1 Tax=Phytohalomonas tamaricis TaxID=2081032 RepID=UPI000D0AF39E|nr:4'-phosphopantetheinyl transferase superfamily protein [Phytohalomonas tamaricis]
MSHFPDRRAFLSDISSFWPFAADAFMAPADATLRHTRFELNAFQRDEFAHHAINFPVRLEQAVAKRQAEYLAGRVCAREALREYDRHDHELNTLPDRRPAWPDGTVGAITHSRDFAAALVADASRWVGVGIDAEHYLDVERAARLKGEILTDAELAMSAAFSPLQLARFVTLVFSAKESLYKTLYPLVGRSFYFHDAQLSAWDESCGSIEFELLVTLSPFWCAGARAKGLYAELEGQLLSLVAVPNMA